MKYDNEGFYYPFIDKTKCINCDLCTNACPYHNDIKGRSNSMHVYGCQNKDDSIRRDSTSGGMFAAIADYVLSKDGAVYGVGYDENMHVIHKKICSFEQIREIQGSKYVQSDLGNAFSEIRKLLQNGKYVLFTGTPCQVEGLYYYLKNIDLTKLLTVDIKCYGVPSSGLFDIFQQYLFELYGSKVRKFYFRDKKYGYSGVNVKAELSNGKIIEDKLALKTYSKTMFSKLGLRRSCYSCEFTTRKKLSDFTLGDIWTIEDYDSDMDDDKGTTCTEINTVKGQQIFDELVNSGAIRIVEMAELFGDKLEKYQSGLKRNYKLDESRRNAFFNEMDKLSYEELMKKYFKDSLKNRIDNVGKPLLNLLPGSSIVFRKLKKRKAGKTKYLK